MNCITLRALVGRYTDCKNMDDMDSIKWEGKLHIPHVPLSYDTGLIL